jgi:hypothetical protein
MGTDDNFATGHRGYDDFDERRHRFRRRPPFAFFLAGMAVVLGVPAAGAGLLVMRDRALVSQANRYAAQYGVTDGGTATRAQRCQGLLLHDAANDPDGALPRSVVRMLAPRVCALAVARGLAHKSGDVGGGRRGARDERGHPQDGPDPVPDGVQQRPRRWLSPRCGCREGDPSRPLHRERARGLR